MNGLIIQGGSLSIQASAPYVVTFSGVSDFFLPFEGTIVVPQAPSAELDFASLDMQDWVFLSLRYPGGSGDTRLFPSLRTFDGLPFSVSGAVICLVDQDHTPLEGLDTGQIFSGSFYSAAAAESHALAIRPKVLLIQLDGSISLPSLPPLTRSMGFRLRANDDPQLAGLRNALNTAVYSGTIYAFDSSGLQTEAYTALRLLGLDETVTGDKPSDDEVRLQLVDLHGNILDAEGFPAEILSFTPSLPAENAQARWFCLPFSANRTLKVGRKSTLQGLAGSQTYRHKFAHVACWPGFDFPLRDVDDSEVQFDLNQVFAGIPGNGLGFLRLCVFHPGAEFQTSGGGAIDTRGIFSLPRPGASAANGFHLYHRDNAVRVFNWGQAFFDDLYDEMTQDSEDEVLEEIYLINWKSVAHMPMRGSMKARGIQPHDEGREAVDAVLETMANNALVCPLDPADTQGGTWFYLLLPNHENVRQEMNVSFLAKVNALPSGVEGSPGIHTGFVQQGQWFGLKLQGTAQQIHDHQILAYWKNSLGTVLETSRTLTGLTKNAGGLPFPEGVVSLGINGDDPPNATLQCTWSVGLMRNYLMAHPELVGETRGDLQLMAINLTSGRSHYIPLVSTSNATLATLAEFEGDDVLAVAVVDRVADPEQDLSTTLLTSFRQIKFPVDAHAVGMVSFHRESLGGVLRLAIARDVIVRAIYYDQFQENLSVDEGLLAGHSNNCEIAALINRNINGKRGYGAVDRATRPVGSLHQKATVLVKGSSAAGSGQVKRLIAYVGGMDLVGGRWDTEEHYTVDPERPGGTWMDCHMKIEGQAARDVLRNFKQRWEALGAISGDAQLEQVYAPKNASDDLTAALQTDIPIPDDSHLLIPECPNALVQVNRTISPSSPHAQIATSSGPFVSDQGEDGILQSYLQAIDNARRFILICEQYFYSDELALALHSALQKPEGPAFAILVLPKNIDEDVMIDPVLFRMRRRAIQCLLYGGHDNSSAGGYKCGMITVNDPGTSEGIGNKVAVLAARNRDGEPVYVHSKQMIVDDVWMTIGSSNMNYRGMSYDMELDAAVIGRNLYRGGSDIVRNQRIEICRLLLGLPKAYSAVLQDPHAVFRMFKALEAEGRTPTLRLHPLPPMVEGLDPAYVKPLGEGETMNEELDLTALLAMNSSAFTFLRCNFLDADGRDTSADGLGPAMTVAGVRNTMNAYVRLTVVIECVEAVQSSIESGRLAYLELQHTTIQLPDEIGSGAWGPFTLFHLELEFDTDGQLHIKDQPGEFFVPISSEQKVVIDAQVVDGDAQPVSARVGVVFDPSQETILPGSFRSRTIDVPNL